MRKLRIPLENNVRFSDLMCEIVHGMALTISLLIFEIWTLNILLLGT